VIVAVPSDLSGLRVWRQADTIVGLADSDPVTTWGDDSGNGFSVSQATTAKKPLYRTNVLNGLPVVRFDGVDDVMSNGSVNWTHVINSAGGGIYTIMAVVLVNAAPTGAAATYDDPALLTDLGGNVGTHFRDAAGLLTIRAYNWDGNEDFAASTGAAYDTWTLVAQDHDNTTLRIERNGGSFATALSGAPSASSTLLFGSNYAGAKFFDGDVAEYVMYNRVLTDTERGDIEAYFTAKWLTAPGASGPYGTGTYGTAAYGDTAGDAFARTAADSFSISDAATTGVVGRVRAAADTFAVADLAARAAATRARTVADSFAVSDAATRGQARARTAADSFSVSDTAARAAATRVRTAADSFTVADSVARVRLAARAASDAFTVTDAAQRALQGSARSASDTVSVTDSVDAGGSQHLAASATDSFAVADSATRQTARARTAPDGFTVADNATRAGARVRSSEDTWTVGDSASARWSLTRSAADSWSVSDSAVAVILEPPPAFPVPPDGRMAVPQPGRMGRSSAGRIAS
jgi:hypothetical protein